MIYHSAAFFRKSNVWLQIVKVLVLSNVQTNTKDFYEIQIHFNLFLGRTSHKLSCCLSLFFSHACWLYNYTPPLKHTKMHTNNISLPTPSSHFLAKLNGRKLKAFDPSHTVNGTKYQWNVGMWTSNFIQQRVLHHKSLDFVSVYFWFMCIINCEPWYLVRNCFDIMEKETGQVVLPCFWFTFLFLM